MNRIVTMGLALALMLAPVGAMAYQTGSVSGTIVDPLGATVAGTVTLYRDGIEVGRANSGVDGQYSFTGLEPGRYRVEAAASGFESTMSGPVFVNGTAEVRVDAAVRTGRLEQEISVTASATALPLAQIGAPVSVIDRGMIEQLGKPDVLDVLRTVPGLAVVQTGARGGTASVFTRGGEGDWTKVMIDGAAANDIGGSFSFDALSTTAIESIEVLRTANSVQYGAGAMSGVVAIQTRRGRSRTPTLSYAVDRGNLGTNRNEVSVGGAVGRFDYFVDGSILDTDNDLPNNEFRNGTFASRVGFLVGGNTDLSATLRRTETDFGTPGAILYHGIPDDSNSRGRLSYATVKSVSAADPVAATLQYSYTERDSIFINPTPTGEAFDPFGFGANYLGNTLTISGANGFSTTGRAILDFGGSFPSVSTSNSKRHVFRGHADVDVLDGFGLSFGARIEDEEGASTFASPDSRRNHGYFVEGRGNIGQRFFATAGLGIEDHAVFERDVVPRLSLALYARQPTADGMVGETKLNFNIGKGIKAPNVFEAQSSIFSLIDGIPAGQASIDRHGIEPIRPERTRFVDIGVEQVFRDGRIRIGVSYFNNRNTDLIEYVSSHILPQLGIPEEVANASGFGGTINAASFDSQGIEWTGEAIATDRLRFSGFYTFLDARVTESFSSSALAPAFNPAFPDIQIGAFSPLVGARPFRRPANSGGLTVSYAGRGAVVSLTGAFVGRHDDSTFLSDPYFGNSMLLPNKDLSGNYQKVDLAGSYQVHRRVKWYATVENLLNQDYQAAGGFPGLPINVRTGVKITVGGDDL